MKCTMQHRSVAEIIKILVFFTQNWRATASKSAVEANRRRAEEQITRCVICRTIGNINPFVLLQRRKKLRNVKGCREWQEDFRHVTKKIR